MNNLLYFWGVEDENLRGDQFDGVSKIARGNSGTVTSKSDTDNPLHVTNWVIRLHPDHPEKINVFCMNAVRPSFSSFPIDERNFRFGDYALILTNPQEFIDRISTHLNVHKIKGKAGLVEYVSNDYTGEFGPFKKLDSFAYQSEWRLVCFDGNGEERVLSIGSIQDFCIVVKSNEANNTISKLLNVDLI